MPCNPKLFRVSARARYRPSLLQLAEDVDTLYRQLSAMHAIEDGIGPPVTSGHHLARRLRRRRRQIVTCRLIEAEAVYLLARALNPLSA